MGEPKPEDILKEAIYESGAVPRTTELAIEFFRPNRENLEYVCIVRIFVDEDELNADVEMKSLIRHVATCVFASAPELLGICIWLLQKSDGCRNGRYSSVSRNTFDGEVPIELTMQLKRIYSDLVKSHLTTQDKLCLYTEDLSYPELDLLFTIGLCDEQSQLFSKQEEIFKEKVFTIAKDVMHMSPLIRSVGMTFVPQNLTARIDRHLTSNEFYLHVVKFEPLRTESYRVSHPVVGSSW